MIVKWPHPGIAPDAQFKSFQLLGRKVAGEFVSGKAPGKDDAGVHCGGAPCLAYRSGYGLVAWHATSFLQPYVRVDARSARHVSGTDFAYVAEVLRATAGVRIDVGRYLIIKAEYTLNRELAPLTEFPDDVLTTSLVVRY